jgi:hypothetical protein
VGGVENGHRDGWGGCVELARKHGGFHLNVTCVLQAIRTKTDHDNTAGNCKTQDKREAHVHVES